MNEGPIKSKGKAPAKYFTPLDNNSLFVDMFFLVLSDESIVLSLSGVQLRTKRLSAEDYFEL